MATEQKVELGCFIEVLLYVITWACMVTCISSVNTASDIREIRKTIVGQCDTTVVDTLKTPGNER